MIKLLSANNLLYLTSIILDIFPLLKFNFNETLQISNDSFNELVNILEILSEHKENNDLSIVFIIICANDNVKEINFVLH